MAVDVEVMYKEIDGNTGMHRQRRSSLDAAYALPRENVLFVILSIATTAARAQGVVVADTRSPPRWSVTGNVERLSIWTESQISTTTSENVCLLVRRKGEVALEDHRMEIWTWHIVGSPSTFPSVTGLPVLLPGEAVAFFGPTFQLPTAMFAEAQNQLGQVMF